jgi:anthranilate phosphoribosyltransferase
MTELIETLKAGADLGGEQVGRAVAGLLDPSADPAIKAAFLVALREKGETAEEIAAFARALLERAVDPGIDPSALPGPLLDVCGTGGDRLDFFNISTAAMFVLAAGGACVAKHGNRGVTSRCGGADVLEALGVRIDLPPSEAGACLAETGMVFLFAPLFHPAFREIAPVRKELAARGISTVFNLLGPILNPASPRRQLTGVFSESWLETYADVMGRMGRERAWALNAGGADELTTVGPARVCEAEAGARRSFSVDPADLGLARSAPEDLRGGGREENAAILSGVLDGSVGGAKRDVVALNAAAGFVVAGIEPDLGAGLERAFRLLADGSALARLEALRRFGGRR